MKSSLVVLLAGLIGFALGAATLGFAALWIGITLLGHVQGGIHSDWALVVFFAALLCFAAGGTTGAKGAVRLAKSLRG